MNIQNYLDFKCEHDNDMSTDNNFRIICKSRNSLFKFSNVTCDVQIVFDDRGNYKSYTIFDIYKMEIDENGNGYV